MRLSVATKEKEKAAKSPKKKLPVRERQKSTSATERRCSIASTVGILADPWAFLVLREAFFGSKRFEEYRSGLEITRATLSDRLRRLVHEGILRESPYSDTSSRVEYKLTKAGIDLYPIFMSLMQFGDRWFETSKSGPLQLIHETCNCVSKPIVTCSCCKLRFSARDVTYIDGPGAGRIAAETPWPSRRTPDDFMRGRPSSVSRAIEVIGDRWSFLILREAFYGNSRFDQLQAELGIATNILTDRLARLIDRGVFRKKLYQDAPERYEYILTPMGTDLHGSLMMIMAWGDRWRSQGRPPMLLRHDACGQVFTPVVVCNRCGKAIDAFSMKYRMRYNPDQYGGRKSSRAVPGRI